MKTIKLGLIASMAVCGFTSLSAQNLTEAIKNVDISGTVAYRYNDYEPSSSTQNNYKVATSIKSKVNEDVTFNSRFLIGDKTAQAVLNTSTQADSNLAVELSEANFSYTGIKNTSITIGKQGIVSPFTKSRDAMGDEQTGTGISAMTSFGPLSLSAAYYNQTNFDSSGNIQSLFVGYEGADFMTVGAYLSFNNFNIDAHYAKATDVLDAYTVGIDYSNSINDFKFKTFARYSSLSEEVSDIDNSLWKAGIKVNKGIFGAFVAYGETDEDGGSVGIDGSSTSGFDEHWRLALSNNADSSMLFADVDVQITPKLNLALKYSDFDAGDESGTVDKNELYLQASYKMSSNLLTYVRFGELEIDDQDDATMGRLHIQYSF
ncbi:porin [Arcobacter sp. LA11]|uniref:porin n=1 Tax=Arcobacter sp. LA11 TaxID=1898176 RepID=UPI00093239CE|nr:porin [Arcobacter sp. LA11]